MTDRPDPIGAWGELSAAAARATGYRRATAEAVEGATRRAPGLASIGLMTVVLAIIVGALALRPASGPAANGMLTAQADDGVFRLALSTPHRTYTPTEAIEPVATVTYLGPAKETSIYRASSLVGFELEEVGGDRALYPGLEPVCATDAIRRDVPVTVPFEKSGAIGGIFDRAWFDDPALHLPVGTWRIRAYTTISTDDGPAPSDGSFTCGTRGHRLEVAIVITVSSADVPTPATSLAPTIAPSVERSVDDGMFRLRLTTPRALYAPGEAIEPIASVTYLGPDPTQTMYHGGSPVGFVIEEVDGDRQMDGGMDLPCLHTAITKDRPIAYPFEKAGTTEHGFDAAWYADPVLRLPAGTWRIRAYLDIDVTDGTSTCGALHHHLDVQNVVTVVDEATPSDTPSPLPSPSPSPLVAPSPVAEGDAATAFAVATAYETARVAGREDAWTLLSPWSQALFGTRAAFERVQANLNATGYATFEVQAPTQDPDLLSPSFLGSRAADLAKYADPARTFLVSVRYPDVDGAAAGTLNLVVAARSGTDSDWQVWVDGTGP